MPGHAHLITDRFHLLTEHMRVFDSFLRSIQAVVYGVDKITRDALLSLAGEASCLGTVFWAYFITGTLDSQTEHAHVFVSSLWLAQAIKDASTRRSCGHMVNVRQRGENDLLPLNMYHFFFHEYRDFDTISRSHSYHRVAVVV